MEQTQSYLDDMRYQLCGMNSDFEKSEVDLFKKKSDLSMFYVYIQVVKVPIS